MFQVFNESVINSKLLANHFKDICKSFVPPYKNEYISHYQNRCILNRKIIYFLSRVKNLMTEKKCHFDSFKYEVLNITDLQLIHLEIFWYLELSDLISIVEVIRHNENKTNHDFIQHIGMKLFKIILECKQNHSSIKHEMLLSYLKAIFGSEKNLPQATQTDDGKQTIYKLILNLISTNLTELYNSEFSDNFNDCNYLNMSYFLQILLEAKTDTPTLNFICEHLIMVLLQNNPQSPKTFLYNLQSKFDVKQTSIFKFFSLTLEHCEFEDLVKQLEKLLLNASKSINWNNMLVFITFLGDYHINGWKKIRNICELILKESFHNLDSNHLSYAFIIARHSCFQKPKGAFTTYLQWFGSSFSSKSSTPINSKAICEFFFDFLTDLAPHDSVQYLKVHCNRIPLVPAECQNIATDYVNSVKTHLEGLNASTDLGICENTTEKSAAAFDVETTIIHYETHQTIMTSVFQSAMFNRSYYEKKFLVELLSKYEGKNSTRHKIIMELNSLGKIPKSAFKKYQNIEKKNSLTK